MGDHTKIQWCDSTLNLMMGCDGCELASNIGSGTCYAEILTARRGGGKNKGWPVDFFKPQLFEHRLDAALRWPDLTGTARADKPWLDGMPRMIFLDDLGDTFTESLPLDWLAPHVPRMAASPHIYLFLTKRPSRMAEFWRGYGSVPANCWLGTSVILNTARLAELVKIEGARLYASVEPMRKPLDLSRYLPRVSWAIFGGESGTGAAPLDVAWLREGVAQCRAAGSAPFVKQLGSAVVSSDSADWAGHRGGVRPTGRGLEERWHIRYADRMGGDWSEWPVDIRVREIPTATTHDPAAAGAGG